MAIRLPRGWSRLKTIGDAQPVLVLINKTTGRFGTTIDSENIETFETLAQAEQHVKAMAEADAIDVIQIATRYGDEVARLEATRVRRVGHNWVDMAGARLPYHTKVYVPDAELIAAVEAKTKEYQEVKSQLARIRDEQSALLRTLVEVPTA